MAETPLVTVTDAAVAHLEKLMVDEEKTGAAVRLGVRGGGCSGLSYLIEFDQEAEGDRVIETSGLRILLDRKSSIYLKGVQLDYDGSLEGKGFVFGNPNASNTCGCGESFSL